MWPKPMLRLAVRSLHLESVRSSVGQLSSPVVSGQWCKASHRSSESPLSHSQCEAHPFVRAAMDLMALRSRVTVGTIS